MNQLDIRIGTLASMSQGASYLQQLLPYGFESFQLTFWKEIGAVDMRKIAPEILQVLGDQAVVSGIAMFCNPLQDQSAVDDFARCIDACRLFNCEMVTGFTGAIEGKPLTDSIPQFKKVWTALARRAEDNGVRIAWENCDMGGWWHDVRWNIAHAPTAWEMLFNEVQSSAVGLEWEPCHQLLSLIDPIPQLRKWVSKIFHVHGKDANVAWDIVREYGIRGGKTYVWHRHPGFGDTNWTDIISILRLHGYKGAIDIEGFHDPVYKGPLETTGQVHALNYLKHCRGGPFIPNPT